MTRIIYTLLLLVLPVAVQCCEEANIHGKVAYYTPLENNICGAVMDFYADGIDAGTEFEVSYRRCDGVTTDMGKYVVGADGWLDELSDRRVVAKSSVGECLVFVFKLPEGEEYRFETAPFPLRFADGRGHEVTLSYAEPDMSMWGAKYFGYENGEVISYQLTTRKNKVRFPERESNNPCIEMLFPGLCGRKHGMCTVKMHSHTKKNDFTFKFGWGRKYLREPTIDWVQNNRKRGLIATDLRTLNNHSKRTKAGLRPCYFYGRPGLTQREDGCSLEQAISNDCLTGERAKVVVDVPSKYELLENPDPETFHFFEEVGEGTDEANVVSVYILSRTSATPSDLLSKSLDVMLQAKVNGCRLILKGGSENGGLDSAYCMLRSNCPGGRELTTMKVFSGTCGGCMVQYVTKEDPSTSLEEQAKQSLEILDSLISVYRTPQQSSAKLKDETNG